MSEVEAKYSSEKIYGKCDICSKKEACWNSDLEPNEVPCYGTTFCGILCVYNAAGCARTFIYEEYNSQPPCKI